jgi:hypothetical protein
MSLLDAFFATLTQAPGDWLTRSALADWYEENGLDRAADCVRWMVRQQRRPSVNAAGMAFWFDAEQPMPWTERAAHLPRALFQALSYTHGFYALYASLRQAEEALHAAWAALLDAGTWPPDGAPGD